MNWDYIFPVIAGITAAWILWTIGRFIEKVLEREADVTEEEEECHDITEWQQKLQEMHRRAQRAESDLAKLESKPKGFNSFSFALAVVSSSSDRIAIQEGENPLIMEKVNGVVVIRNQTNNMLANYISPQWLNMNWRLERVHN